MHRQVRKHASRQETGSAVHSQAYRGRKERTAIEYGLIATLIAVAAIAAMQGLGNNLKSTFNSAANSCGGQGEVQKLKQLIRCNKGATAIEYAILAALVATAAIAAFIQLGDEVEASFNRTSNAMGSSTTTP